MAELEQLETYRELCLRTSGFHTAQRYPSALHVAMEEDELEALLKETDALLDDLETA